MTIGHLLNTERKTGILFRFFINFIVGFLLMGCEERQQVNLPDEEITLPAENNNVDIVVVKKQVFASEIISNGKISAALKAELYFDISGQLDSVPVKNGQQVKKGEVLAIIQNDQVQYNFRKAKLALEKAGIDRLDALLSMGYKHIHDSGIQEEHLIIANIRSGFSQASLEFEEISSAMDHLILTAPFNGKVEGIIKSLYEKTNPSEIFCSLINEEHFIIRFPLLETEAGEVYAGQEIRVTPISETESVSGKISGINPRVDSNGLIWIQGEIPNPGGYMDGMNVRVSIKKEYPGQLVVPRNAVVLRQNREVLFRYTDGKAWWTYIHLLNENENQYAVLPVINGELNPGDTVIISNNLNLAHLSNVEIQ